MVIVRFRKMSPVQLLALLEELLALFERVDEGEHAPKQIVLRHACKTSLPNSLGHRKTRRWALIRTLRRSRPPRSLSSRLQPATGS